MSVSGVLALLVYDSFMTAVDKTSDLSETRHREIRTYLTTFATLARLAQEKGGANREMTGAWRHASPARASNGKRRYKSSQLAVRSPDRHLKQKGGLNREERER